MKHLCYVTLRLALNPQNEIMKLKNHFSYNSKTQLWRLLINNNDLMLIESRDTETKEVFYSIFDFAKGKLILDKMTLPEKIWLGVETFYNNLIFFHTFVKPDLPMHKGIIVYDITKNKIVWENQSYTFLMVDDNKVIAQTQGFEETYLYSLDITNGTVIEQLNLTPEEIDIIHNRFTDEYNYGDYSYPEKFATDENNSLDEFIDKYTAHAPLKFPPEVLETGDFYFCNLHLLEKGNIINRFFAVDKNKNKIIEDIVLNSVVNAYVPESFFMYKDYVILLIEKKGVLIYKTE